MRGEEWRESILRSARHVFVRCGYTEASTGELMLNLSGDVAQVLDEMSRVWLRGLHAHGN